VSSPKTAGVADNDFFVNLLDMRTEWNPFFKWRRGVFEGREQTGELKWTASSVDLVFRLKLAAPRIGRGLRQFRCGEKFGFNDFVAAWNKGDESRWFDLLILYVAVVLLPQEFYGLTRLLS